MHCKRNWSGTWCSHYFTCIKIRRRSGCTGKIYIPWCSSSTPMMAAVLYQQRIDPWSQIVNKEMCVPHFLSHLMPRFRATLKHFNSSYLIPSITSIAEEIESAFIRNHPFVVVNNSQWLSVLRPGEMSKFISVSNVNLNPKENHKISWKLTLVFSQRVTHKTQQVPTCFHWSMVRRCGRGNWGQNITGRNGLPSCAFKFVCFYSKSHRV